MGTKGKNSKPVADEDITPLSGEKFLEVNRKKREEAKVDAEQEAKRKAARTPGKVVAPAGKSSKLAGTGRPAGALVVACALLAAAAIGCAVWAITASRSGAMTDPQSAHGQSALKAARENVVAVTTYRVDDYAALDRRIREVCTTDFAEKMIESSPASRKGNTAAGASSKASAEVAGLIALSADRAEALVALNQTITAPDIAQALPAGHQYQSRVKVTLVRDGDRWLLDALDVV